MLKISVLLRHAAARASHYYSDQSDDYYAKEGASQWQGEGASRLGLDGEVDPKRFTTLLRGEIGPGMSMSRSSRNDQNARAGLDFTFSAPKSVTLQALLGKDRAVIDAHDHAVAKALQAVEGLARSRKKVQGKSFVESTGNLVIAKFRHETARPIPGAPPDPQLHTHAIVLNMTQREDGAWRALDNTALFEMKQYVDTVYLSEMAGALRQAGYDLQFNKDGSFDLAHISREQIEGFSKRSQQMEAALADRGLNRSTATAEEKQRIILKTRRRKDTELSREELQIHWKKQADELGIDFGKPSRQIDGRSQPGKAPLDHLGHDRPAPEKGPSLAPSRPARPNHPSDPTVSRPLQPELTDNGPVAIITPAMKAADIALRWAIAHMTERESVMSGTLLRTHALSHASGLAQAHDIDAAIKRYIERGRLLEGDPLYQPATAKPEDKVLTRAEWIAGLTQSGRRSIEQAQQHVDRAIVSGALVQNGTRYTTAVALEREQSILRVEARGRGQVVPIMSKELSTESLASATLNAGQLAASELMLTTGDRVVGVQGLAGTGKSHMLEAVTKVITEEGYTVRTVASYGTQVRALRELGVESNTIASMLAATTRGRFTLDEKTVLIVDEAGVVPTRLMEKLLQAAEKANTRVVLLGDTAQTKAIEAGRPFHQLQAAGMATATMDEIQRQRDPQLKKAVELAAIGEGAESLSQITTIEEVPEARERHAAVAQAYARLPAAERDDTLIVTGTNESRQEINNLVRQELGTDGQGHVYDLLTRRDTTQAERRHARYYVDGDIIQPERNYKCGLARGELYTITDRGPGNLLTVEDQNGQKLSFNPSRVRRISVYEPTVQELAPGDWVRVTRNDAERDLSNGSRFQVVASTADELTLAAGDRQIVLPRSERLHLDLAYATTVHSAQGLTSERVIINADSHSRTTKEDVYYVAISRARRTADIYTDNRDKLPAAIERDASKTAALDITHPSYSRPFIGGSTAVSQGSRGTSRVPTHSIENRVQLSDSALERP